MVSKKPSPRQRAVEVLTTILELRKPLKTVLEDRVLSDLDPSDRALLKEIVYGVLRQLYYLDYVLERFYKNKDRLSLKTINNLRTAVYQLLFMEMPDYAVTNEAVEVEKSLKGTPSVVNGILRNLLRQHRSKTDWDELILQEFNRDKVKFLSIYYSYPLWLLNRWIRRFGVDELENMLKINNQKPPFTIAVKVEEREEVIEYLEKRGFKATKTKFSPAGITIEGKGYEIREELKNLPFFWVVQDEASQLVCFLLEPKEGGNILDACSSPGGKALLTATLLKEGKVLCLERDKERFKVLEQNVERLRRFITNVNIELKLSDLFEFESSKKFDRILLDAPCSSLGVLRRNPDIKYRCSIDEIKRLSNNQLKMLMHLRKFVEKEGIIIYSVCSTEPEEGESVVDKFLQEHVEFCTMNIETFFLAQLQQKEGIIRTFPHRHNMDGFFMARLYRK